jgi:DinB superfamily
MTHNTTQLLLKLHERTESILQKAISEWQMLPAESLATQPASDKWTAAQCLEHLNIYGHHYLPAIDKAIQAAKLSGNLPVASFSPGWLGAYFTQLMAPQPDGSLKKKMRSPKEAVPSAAPDPVTTLAEFIEQQEHMLQLLEAAKSVNLNTVRVPISLTPWIRLKLGDTFGFVVAHVERHVVQAERGLECYTKPPF